MENKSVLIAKLLKLRDNEQLSFGKISKMLNVPESTLRDWYYGTTRGDNSTQKKDSVGYIQTNKSEHIKYSQEDIYEFIQNLAPIVYPAPLQTITHKSTTNTALVIGDMHFGQEDWPTLNIFLETVNQLKPSQIILNGDTLDMFAVSRYPKDIRHLVSLRNEREQFHKFLYLLHEVADGDAQIFETNSNHSGDGHEGRWWKFLSLRLGELSDLPEIKEKLSYESIFYPPEEWSRIKLVDYVEILPGFVVMHGDVVRKHGGYSARGLLEKWFSSIIANHTHRVGMTSQRIPSLGKRHEKLITVYENGCACNLKPLYASAANWQNSFCIVNYDDEQVGVEQVLIENNKANICTLGVSIKG